jgi:hypothetical protein
MCSPAPRRIRTAAQRARSTALPCIGLPPRTRKNLAEVRQRPARPRATSTQAAVLVHRGLLQRTRKAGFLAQARGATSGHGLGPLDQPCARASVPGGRPPARPPCCASRADCCLQAAPDQSCGLGVSSRPGSSVQEAGAVAWSRVGTGSCGQLRIQETRPPRRCAPAGVVTQMPQQALRSPAAPAAWPAAPAGFARLAAAALDQLDLQPPQISPMRSTAHLEPQIVTLPRAPALAPAARRCTAVRRRRSSWAISSGAS